MKVLIACGGTGGHLFPGLAVAEKLRQRQHQVELLISEKAVDQAAVSALTCSSAASGITVRAVSAVGYTGWRGLIRFCNRFARALGACGAACRQFQPDVVLGMGGYTSAPAVVAGKRHKGTATVIHESNAIPGKANRWTGKFADHVAVGLPDCAKFFGGDRVTVTGTPIRQSLRQGRLPGAQARLGLYPQRTTVLIMGGSQGAHAINQAMAAALPWLMSLRDQIQFVHLTGRDDADAVRAAYCENDFHARVLDFCDAMEWPYSAADVVVARAGAATLSEIAVFGLPAILIPFPQATGNHQWHNANVFQRIGAATVVEQTGLAGQPLAGHLIPLLTDSALRAGMAQAARSLAVTDADDRIANLVESYAN